MKLRIRDLREDKDLTQTAIAKKLILDMNLEKSQLIFII